MQRRSFLKLGLLAAAASTVGIRPSTASAPQPLPVSVTAVCDFDAVEAWYGTILDVDLPADQIFFIVQTQLHENDLFSRCVENLQPLEFTP